MNVTYEKGVVVFRVIVAGGRGFGDYELLKARLDLLLANKRPAEVVVVSGTASGADRLGERYARERGLALERHPADWEGQGRQAGMRRNERMADHAEALVAFWDGRSPGTRHMIEAARARGLAVRVVRY
jgi:hypothetical protein